MPSLVYQVFVDRFERGRAQPTEPERAREEGTVRRAWHEAPEEPPNGRDLFGGDLDGVAARLPHVESLGADAIWLTPIFRAPSNHKYDAASFDAVDEHFGGDAAFERLAAAARARGIALYLDGVFNHVGERHPWARRPELLSGSVWRGFSSLPELDLANDEVRAQLFGPGGVVERWTRRGARGWRLDCANDLGRDVCARIAAAARAAGADAGVIGEVMAWPAGWTGEPGAGLDGVMNYWLRSAALELASGTGRAQGVQAALDRLAAEMDPRGLRKSWNVVSSHDTPRLSTALGSEPRARLALALAFVYPGVPLLYYGEEIAMTGAADPANRAPMIWDERRWDASRLAWVRQLAAIRRREPALDDGRYVSLAQPGHDVIAFARVTDRPHDTLVFVANARSSPVDARLFLPLPDLFDALPLADLLDENVNGRALSKVEAGTLAVSLPAHGCALYKPKDDHASGYRFFK
jgi:alpha-glucosidase